MVGMLYAVVIENKLSCIKIIYCGKRNLPIENARRNKNWVTLYADSLYTWALHKLLVKKPRRFSTETFLAAVQFFERYKEKAHPKHGLLHSQQ